jgi:signal-transduction protein with cAMP-binding, CBS, and nucleotidyltransferase domain
MLVAGAWALVVPGLGQPAAEWKRALELLRRAPAQPAPRAVRAATLADFDALAVLLPSLSGLGASERGTLMGQAQVSDVPSGSTIVRHGEVADDAYFIMAGKAVAGVETEGGAYRSLSTLGPGDFFGEIAALTGVPRTANVVAEEQTTLLTVPGTALRRLMTDPALRRLFLTKMSERLSRTHASDWPRLAGVDQEALRELRATERSSG